MEQEQINQVLEIKKFKLNDFDRTFNKYKNYKKEKVDLFFNENLEDIKRYIEGTLFYLVLGELEHKFENFNYLHLFQEPLNKKKINMLMREINGITFNKNQEFIKELDNLNQNEIKNFTIILYLNNYEKINNIMKKVLLEYLKNYTQRMVINKLK